MPCPAGRTPGGRGQLGPSAPGSSWDQLFFVFMFLLILEQAWGTSGPLAI